MTNPQPFSEGGLLTLKITKAHLYLVQMEEKKLLEVRNRVWNFYFLDKD